ncbi:MAG TPA: Dyp-type peroxidase [Acidimicrobiia bacterium]|nr:Dyp-type peroxidase [Acidimicrobiia bacterium]
MGGTERRVSRRSLLKAGGAGAALGAFGGPLRPLVDDPSHDRRGERDRPGGEGGNEADTADPEIDLAEIQGNVLAGFNKDHQRLLFFRLDDVDRARAWLATIVDETATSEEVLAFNDVFRRARARRRAELATPQATWLNVAFTHPGLAALGVSENELSMFPEAFRQGMAARAPLLGDVDESAPARWVGPFASSDVHGLLLLAADAPSALDRLAGAHTQRMAAHGVRVVFEDTGRARADQPGHEHFGFKDGVSQPGIRGVTRRQNPDDDEQGLPGQDLLWPGEFVLGYPTQAAMPDPKSDDGANGNPGPVSRSGPAWTTDGSYLVFRRLRQDVAGFRRFVAGAAAEQGVSTERLGAKLVGRYPSGAPLERTEDVPHDFDPTKADPSRKNPSILDPTRINNFEFAKDDGDGRLVPRAAHIRKAYPRDEMTPTGGEADTQTHRLLRRGIPYGESFREGAPTGSTAGADADRGLLFLGYQASLERQFEFVVSQWFNKPDHPERGDGHDPILSQSSRTKQFTLPGGSPVHLTMQRFVFTTGGAYLFQPSISALRRLSRPSAATNPAPPLPAPSPRSPRLPLPGPPGRPGSPGVV